MSLRARLLATQAGIWLIGLLASAVLILDHAREAVLTESAANLALVQELVRRGIVRGDRLDDATLDELREVVPRIRHVRVMRVAHGARDTGVTLGIDVGDVPVWFVGLVAPPTQTLPRTILAGEGEDLIIVANPADEIAEVWEDVKPLALIAVIVFTLICVLLYVGIGRGLRPLGDLLEAFERLARNDLSARANEGGSAEMARINAQFNRTAAVLESTVRQNRSLSARLVNLQEEERRHLVRELHDDMAPCLFDIRVRVGAIGNLVDANSYDRLPPQLEAIEQSVEDLQARVRVILRRLRPLALDELGLEQALRELIASWRERMPDVHWTLEVSGLGTDLADALQVTVYRLVQEALTNVARHSGALHASVCIRIEPGAPAPAADSRLVVTITDDGRGLPAGETPGLGLRGLRERVQALGGELTIASSGDSGTSIHAVIPIEREPALPGDADGNAGASGETPAQSRAPG
jgi:two-component system sensor histidine kinase UhpB